MEDFVLPDSIIIGHNLSAMSFAYRHENFHYWRLLSHTLEKLHPNEDVSPMTHSSCGFIQLA